jgi:hypothetical protein
VVALRPLYKSTIANFPGYRDVDSLLGLEFIFIRRPASGAHTSRAARRFASAPVDLTMLPRDPMPSRELEHLRDAFGYLVDRLRTRVRRSAEQFEGSSRIAPGSGYRSSSRSSVRSGSRRSANVAVRHRRTS